jgi:hypothetical protein
MATTKKQARRTSGAAAKKAPAKTVKTARPPAPPRQQRRAQRRRARRVPPPAATGPPRLRRSPPPRASKPSRPSSSWCATASRSTRDEYVVIDALKLRAARLGRITKKSELLRAGLKLLAACADAGLLGALEAVPPVKTGRPKGKRHGKDAASEGGAAAPPRNG